MRVRLLTQRVGEFSNHMPGEIVEVPDAEARRLIDSDQAVAAPIMDRDREAAMLAPPRPRRKRE